MSAQTLLQMGRTVEATERLEAGIAAAERTGNPHAAAEMIAMREGLDTPS